jgi:2-C-methyl-D-erythritol 4-phosphate cytidylyltransferase/2-C-methyl-D-erythritol 2,4-cyclodiphosphate synthase
MTLAVLIVAAGRGTRAGGGLPKQWQALAGARVIDHTLARFRALPAVNAICVVLHPDDMGLLGDDVIKAAGGATRDASVRAGLAALAGRGITRVLVHDAARPCTPLAVIHAVIAALDHGPAAAPAIPVTDALWHGACDRVTGVHPREGLYRAQTPQGFHYAALIAAHAAHPGGAADDVAVARAAGLDVTIVPGHEDNLKITLPADFARAERILRGDMDIRLGNGFDVHRFCPGDHVWLCGVKVPHGAALDGHSDADVGLHALADAIYGALAQGDIGRHFPPSDPQWKGAESHIFLSHAAELARTMGYTISNVDCTLVCERPKITPHADAMRARVAAILRIDVARVSVKATTSERLGFTGREEGIAALTTACLVKV